MSDADYILDCFDHMFNKILDIVGEEVDFLVDDTLDDSLDDILGPPLDLSGILDIDDIFEE